MRLFEQTLFALRDGGPTFDSAGRVVHLPPAPDPALRAQLDEAVQTWAAFRAQLQPVNATALRQPFDDAQGAARGAALQTESLRILAQLDAVVGEFEARAQAKLFRLQLIQAAFFAAALLLLAWGYALTRRGIVEPLTELGAAARRIAGGQLGHPVPVLGKDELGELGLAFETMRAEIAAARDLLEARVAQRTRELASAFEFSQEIVAQRDLAHLLRLVTDRARRLTRAEAASLCLLDAAQTALVLAASSGNGQAASRLRQPLHPPFVQRVVEAGETVITDTTCAVCGFLQAYTPGQGLAAPLRTGSVRLGALCVVRRRGGHFDADETRALTLLANAAAIAITNAQLAEAEQRQAGRAAALAERERLAAELHDQLAQTLSFLNLKADRVRERLAADRCAEAEAELNQMKSAIGGAYGQVRAALTGLRAPLPVAEDFAHKLAACVTEFREASGLAAELTVADPSALQIPPAAQAQVAHILREALTNVRRHAQYLVGVGTVGAGEREALTNVRRHAQANRVQVRVERAAPRGDAHFTVEDDGRGFDPHQAAGDNHLGLLIMRTRAERSGGRLRVDSAPGAGTRVAAVFPLVEHERLTAGDE
jgi:two-component system nitrate/nitrite sensor histidine kinase NarX